MKTTLTKQEFIRRFKESPTYRHAFSDEGLSALFDYFTGLEEGLGEEIEFDIVAICGDYHEYKDIESFNYDYNTNYTHYNEIEDRFIIPVNGKRFIVEI